MNAYPIMQGDAARFESIDAPEVVNAFTRNVFSVLERTEYRRVESGEDLESIYRLRYKSYRLNDLVPENAEGTVHDAFDDLPNCHRFGVYIDGNLVSTLRLFFTHVSPEVETTLRLAGMACFHFNAPYCISMIREDHAAFYKRVYRSRPIGDARPYEGVINCFALLYQADVLAIQDETFARFPFFWSSPVEQRLLFGTTRKGDPAPLTVLPTAKYMRKAA